MRVEICYQLSPAPLSALHLPLHYLRSTSRPPVITETADTDYCKYFQIFTSNISAFNPPSLPHPHPLTLIHWQQQRPYQVHYLQHICTRHLL